MQFTALHPLFAARFDGFDLREPMTADRIEQVHQAMNRFAVVLFRGQQLTADQQMAFGEALGPVETSRATVNAEDHRLKHSLMNDISNLASDGSLLARDSARRFFNLGNRLWHTDSSFKSTPAKYSLLYAHDVPEGQGDTEFADMRAAYDALDQSVRDKLTDQVAMHSLLYSRALLGFHDFSDEEQVQFQPVPQRMVRRHPGSGRLGLYLAAHIGDIKGWEVPEAMIFVRELIEHATRREFVFRHQWRNGDLIIWDNRCTMHRATPFDDVNQVRDLRRVTISDYAPTLEQPV
jgi:alpha-ketoglutarate-dependent 2,4-dichlorophenoxyacetate dioxygenase